MRHVCDPSTRLVFVAEDSHTLRYSSHISQPSEDEVFSAPTATTQDGVVLQASRELLWIESAADARTTKRCG